MNKKSPRKIARDFVWRGSKFNMRMTTHDAGNDQYIPCLQITYSARVAVKGSTLADQIEHAKGIGDAIMTGLTNIPTVDLLDVKVSNELQNKPHKGRIGRP